MPALYDSTIDCTTRVNTQGADYGDSSPDGWWSLVETPTLPRPYTLTWRRSGCGEATLREWTTTYEESYVAMEALRAAGLPIPVFETCPACSRNRDAETLLPITLIGGDTITACEHCRTNEYVYSRLEQGWIHNYSGVYVEDTDDYVSSEYARAHLVRCTPTGDWYLSEAAAEEAAHAYYENDDDHSAVFSYHSATPMAVHGWPAKTPKTSLCFGVELEMEASDSDSTSQDDLADALGGRTGGNAEGGTYILMNDGSLDSTGVELITNPYTLEFHQRNFGWKALLSNVTGIAKSGRGTSNCGMHVHCNRKAISALTLGKALVFVNSSDNSALIERIAQRNGGHWARRAPKKIVNGKVRRTDKYEAMHITEKTIEFRIFRGNLRWDRVLKNIEFCHSVFNYAATASMEAVSTKKDYLQWLNKNRGMYPNLVKFLGETYGFKDTAKNKARSVEI